MTIELNDLIIEIKSSGNIKLQILLFEQVVIYLRIRAAWRKSK